MSANEALEQEGSEVIGIPANELILSNLDSMTVDQIKQVSARANHVLITKQSESRLMAYKRCEDIALAEGLSLAQLVKSVEEDKNLKIKSTKKSVKVKYQNPDNAEEKWSGRGKRPNWLKVLLLQGEKIEKFEV